MYKKLSTFNTLPTKMQSEEMTKKIKVQKPGKTKLILTNVAPL